MTRVTVPLPAEFWPEIVYDAARLRKYVEP